MSADIDIARACLHNFVRIAVVDHYNSVAVDSR